MIKATNKKGIEVEPIEAGSYPARIYQLIEIGTVAGFQGSLQAKVRIGFELPTELHTFNEEKGEQPRVISQDYTLSFNEKAKLRKVIEACDPKALQADEEGFMEEFDVETLVGKPLLITIAQKPKKDGSGAYAFIDNCTRLPKGMNCPAPINPTNVLSYDKWKDEVFEAFPDFIKDKMKTSMEYKKLKGLDIEEEKLDSPF